MVGLKRGRPRKTWQEKARSGTLNVTRERQYAMEAVAVAGVSLSVAEQRQVTRGLKGEALRLATGLMATFAGAFPADPAQRAYAIVFVRVTVFELADRPPRGVLARERRRLERLRAAWDLR